MSKLQAFWVHGTSVQMEREGYFISKRRAGYGAVFQSHGKEWFHFAIPTPVLLDSVRSSLNKVFVLYKTSGTSIITNVHIYDGAKKIHSFDGLRDFNGDHSQIIGEKNKWVLPHSIEVKFGIGISVQVDFGPPTKNGVPSIEFVTAGADFAN